MSGVSIYRKRDILQLKKQALELYQKGLSVRQVGKVVNKSHTWVANAVKELSTVTLDTDLLKVL